MGGWGWGVGGEGLGVGAGERCRVGASEELRWRVTLCILLRADA